MSTDSTTKSSKNVSLREYNRSLPYSTYDHAQPHKQRNGSHKVAIDELKKTRLEVKNNRRALCGLEPIESYANI